MKARTKPVAAVLRREFRVACSRRAQPVWFRFIKWGCLLAGGISFGDRGWFWWVLALLLLVALTVHCLYRAKTKVWTRPWGGWHDLAAGRD